MAKILVVDDDEHMRFFLRKAVERAGHEVLEADNGLVADELLSRNNVDPRSGSVSLNNLDCFYKWFSTLVMLQPGLVAAH